MGHDYLWWWSHFSFLVIHLLYFPLLEDSGKYLLRNGAYFLSLSCPIWHFWMQLMYQPFCSKCWGSFISRKNFHDQESYIFALFDSPLIWSVLIFLCLSSWPFLWFFLLGLLQIVYYCIIKIQCYTFFSYLPESFLDFIIPSAL